MSSGQAVRGVVLRGMSTDALKRLPALAGNVRAGALDDLSQSGRVAIGLRLAERYGIGVGDPVTLIAPRGTVTHLALPSSAVSRCGHFQHWPV